MAIRGGKVKSIKALKSSLKKGSSGSYLERIKEEGFLARFLQEPEEWIEYFEYYDEADKAFYPEVDGVTLPTDSKSGERVKPSKRYLANAINVNENKVVPLVLPKSVAGILLKRYEKYGTLLDRDYELSREGTGFDTEYDAVGEPPSRMNLSKYDPLDLIQVLESQLPGGDEDEDDDDEDDTPRRKPSKSSKSSKSSTTSTRRSRPSPTDLSKDPFDEDEDEDDDDEPVYRNRDDVWNGKSKATARARKKPVAKARPKRRLSK